MPIDKREIKATIGRILRTAENRGIVVLPSTQRKIKAYCYKAQQRGLLKNERDVALSVAAIISAGAEWAGQRRRHARGLKVRDINEGYRAIAIPQDCPGNIPPHWCFRRTILTRENELRSSMPLMNDLMIASEE